MLCKNPFFDITQGRNLSGKKALTAKQHPCGQCLHCRINQSRVWTHRLMLEKFTSQCALFVTLTYNDEHLPPDHNLRPKDLTNFIKRLRKIYAPIKIRYYAVGEYGGTTYRPHYHIVLYSDRHIFPDDIEQAWRPGGVSLGFVKVGELTSSSARYMTGYIISKLTKRSDEALIGRVAEYMTCSKMKGGIGSKAALTVANQLKNSPNFKNETVINSFSYGKKKSPLGRYLSEKVSDVLENRKQRLVEYLTDDYLNYGEIELSTVCTGDYMNKVMEVKKDKRLSQEKKFKIFKQKRSL